MKFDFERLKGAFIERFDLASDKQQLLIDYHDLCYKYITIIYARLIYCNWCGGVVVAD